MAALSATSTAQRDALLGGQFELNRKLAVFMATFNETMEDSVAREVMPRNTNSSGPTTWDMMTLVEDHEVEIKVLADRFALDIQNQCEWELRELDTYMGAAMHLKTADHERNPLRPEIIGRALVRAIEASTDRPEVRKALSVEIGRLLANAMRQTYLDVMGDLRAAGVKPLKMTRASSRRAWLARGLLRDRLRPGPRQHRLERDRGLFGSRRPRRGQWRQVAAAGGPAAFARSSRGSGVDGFACQHSRPQRPHPVPGDGSRYRRLRVVRAATAAPVAQRSARSIRS